MKLQLSQSEGIAVLSITGKVEQKSAEVLLAGVKKLLRDGKNKIILDMKGIEHITPDAIREIAVLNITAKELSGRLAVVHRSTDNSFINFASPPVIDLFHEKEAALEFLGKEIEFDDSEDENEDSPIKTDELVKQIEERDKMIIALQNQIKVLSAENTAQLREENAALKKQNETLQVRTFQLIKDMREPSDVESYKQKIQMLERTVKSYETELKK